MRVAGQCLLRLTVVMARAFQTKISQNALQPKQSGVLCDMLYFRNNSSSGMTATLLLIYSAGLLENTHTQTQSQAKSHKCQFGSWVHQEQSCYTPTRSSFPCQPFLDRLMLDKCLGSCCSNFYRLDRAVASTSLELLTHFFMDVKRRMSFVLQAAYKSDLFSQSVSPGTGNTGLYCALCIKPARWLFSR